MKLFYLKTFTLFFSIVLFLMVTPLAAQRKMESLGRGTIAIRTNSSTVFVSWRIKAEELNNGTNYNLYRDNTLIASNLTVSNYTDANTLNSTYSVSAVVKGIEQDQSPQVNTFASQVLTVPIQNIGDYYVHLAWVGDLDGDGEYEFVVDRIPNAAGISCKLEAYDIDGTRLWQIDMGPLSIDRDGIEGGAAVISNGMWDGVTVYDLDMDGKSEVVIKSANGTVFGDGSTLSYPSDIQNFLSVVDGWSGSEKSRIALPADYMSDGPLQTQFNIAYLDGVNPSVVVKAKNRIGSGDFNMLIAAYDYDTALSLRWKWLRGNQNCPDFHQQRIADVDLDGKDEICDGGYVIDDNGTLLYSLGEHGIVHGDRFQIGDFDPDRPGLEGYAIQQDNPNGLAWYYYDASNGSMLQTQYLPTIGDYGRGNAADLDPYHTGFEMWTFTDGIYNVQDGKITNKITASYPNLRLWWDGDVQSEMLDGLKFLNWNYTFDYEERIITASDWGATTTWRTVPVLYGDITGDWREEVVYEKSDRTALLIFNTVIPTQERIYTLLQNPEYRMCLTTKGYYQSAQLDYFLGFNMTTPPTPPIKMANVKWGGTTSLNWNETDSNWLINDTLGKFTPGDSVIFGSTAEGFSDINVNLVVEPAITYVISAVDYEFSGPGEVSGKGDLVKSGYGNLTFNMKLSHTGETRIEQGTLVANDSVIQSDIKVFGGATLAGNGTLSGKCSFARRSCISPGNINGTGTLSFKQNLTIGTDVTVKMDVTDDSTNILKPGDKIFVDGDLIIEDGAILKITEFNDKIYPGSYPLVNFRGNFTGELSKVKIEGLFGRKYTLIDTLNTIYLDIMGSREATTITWNGSGNIWDLQKSANWRLKNENTVFINGDSVIFNSNGSAQSTVILDGELPIGRMTINGDSVNYLLQGNGIIGGNGDIIKNDNGILQLLSGANSYTGRTVINGGSLMVNKLNIAGAPSSIGANPSTSPDQFILNNAIFRYLSTNDTYTDKGIMLDGQSDTIIIDSPAATVSVSGLLTGNGQLVKTGNGTLYLLGNNNNFSGGTILEGGTIQLNDPGSSLNVEALGTGTFTFKDGKLIMGDTRDYTKCNLDFHIPEGYSGTLITDQRCNYNGKLTGSGTLNLNLPGTIDRTIFNGDWSSFTGVINASGNSFRIKSTAGFPNATVNLNPGLTMYFDAGTSSSSNSSQTVRIGSLAGVAGSFLKDENWIIGENNDSTYFSGTITGNSLTKEGKGSLFLETGNTYAGGTNVNNGNLFVNNTAGSGTGSGQVTVNSGGLIGGTGIINGPLVVNSGGIIQPGERNDFKKLTINNSLTFQPGSKLHLETYNTGNESDYISAGDNQVILNGSLEFEEKSSDSYVVGQEFLIIEGSNITGQFEEIVPGSPGAGLLWDTTMLRSTGKILVASAVSTEEVLAGNIFTYPNPVSNKLFISWPENIQVKQVLIKDISGKVLNCINTPFGQMDLTSLPAGIYFIEITSNKARITKRIVKV